MSHSCLRLSRPGGAPFLWGVFSTSPSLPPFSAVQLLRRVGCAKGAAFLCATAWATASPQLPSTFFFNFNSALGPPYHVLVDTNFINFSIKVTP